MDEEESKIPVTLRQLDDRMRQHPDALWRLSLSLDRGEFCLKVYAAWLICRAKERLPHGEAKENLNNLCASLKRPTLGDWRKTLDPGNSLWEKGSGIGRILTDGITTAASELTTIRNDFAHGGTPSLPVAEKIASKLNEICRILQQPMLDGRMILIAELQEVDQAQTWCRISIREGQETIGLFPWIIGSTTGMGTLASIFVFNRFDKGGFEYVDHGTGETKGEFGTAADKLIRDSLNQHFADPGEAITFDTTIEDLCRGSVDRPEVIDPLGEKLYGAQGQILWLSAPAGYGKTTVIARLIRRIEEGSAPDIVLLHFCSRSDSKTTTWKAVERNLRAQANRHLGQKSESLSGALRELGTGHAGRLVFLFVDALDEMNQASEIHDSLAELVQLAGGNSHLRVLISGQPTIRDEINRCPEAGVVERRLGGMTAVDVKRIAERRELRIAKWRTEDFQRLARRTEGLPLYIDTFLKEYAEDRVGLDQLELLPKSVEGFWHHILDRVEKGLSRDELADTLKHVKGALDEVHRNAGGLVPNLKGLRDALTASIERRTGRESQRRFLYLLSVVGTPISVGAIAEITGLEDKAIGKALKAYAAFLRTSEDRYSLYHGHVGAFLADLEGGAEAEASVIPLVEGWIKNRGQSEESKRVALPFLMRQWRIDADPLIHEPALRCEALIAELLEDWDFLLWAVQNEREILHASVDELAGETWRDELRGSYDSPFYPAIGSEGVLVDACSPRNKVTDSSPHGLPSEVYESLFADDLDDSPSTLDFRPDHVAPDLEEEPLSEEEKEELRLEALELERELRERTMGLLKGSWVGQSKEIEGLIASIRRAAKSGVKQEENGVHSAVSRIALVQSFLTSNVIALEKAAFATCPEKVFAAICERSHLPLEHPLRLCAEGIIAGIARPRIRPVTTSHQAPKYAECLARRYPAIGDVVCASHQTFLAYVEEPAERDRTKPAILVVADWLEGKSLERKSIPLAEWPEDGKPRASNATSVLAMSSDGERILYAREQSLFVWNWRTNHTRSLTCITTSELKAVTPDLREGIFSVSGTDHRSDFAWVDLANDTLIQKVEGYELWEARIVDSGDFAFIYGRTYRSLDIWTKSGASDDRRTRLLGLSFNRNTWSEERPLAFAASPNGRLIYLHGHIYDSGSLRGESVRFIQDHKPNETVAFSPDSRLLACSKDNGELNLYDILNWELLATYRCRRPAFPGLLSIGLSSIQFSPDSRFVMLIHRGAEVSVVDLLSPSRGSKESAGIVRSDFSVAAVAPNRHEIVIVNDSDGQNHGLDPVHLFSVYNTETMRWTRLWFDPDSEICKDPPQSACFDGERILVPRRGFFLDEYCRLSGKLLSRKNLVEWQPEIDWSELATLSDPDISESNRIDEEVKRGLAEGRYSSEEFARECCRKVKIWTLGELAWFFSDDQPSGCDLVYGEGTNNVLFAFDPRVRSISRITRVREFNIEAWNESWSHISVSPGLIIVRTHERLLQWLVGQNELSNFAMGNLSFDDVCHLDAGGVVALFSRGRLIGWLRHGDAPRPTRLIIV